MPKRPCATMKRTAVVAAGAWLQSVRLTAAQRRRSPALRACAQRRVERLVIRNHLEEQHEVALIWIGGHFTSPYEQKTQQSPGFGFSSEPQP